MDYSPAMERSLLGLPAESHTYEPMDGGKITIEEWVDLCCKCRANARLNNMKVVIGGTRAILNGEKLTNAGLGKTWLVSSLLAKGLSKQDQERVGL